jgi:hypothetical protein
MFLISIYSSLLLFNAAKIVKISVYIVADFGLKNRLVMA